MPTHPLVKQAIRCFSDEPVQCGLAVRTNKLPTGNYPFAIYEWQYKGIKPNCVLRVVTSNNIDSKLMLELIYNAQDSDGIELFDTDKLENLHFSIWKPAKEQYLIEAQQSIRFKMSSLISSQQGQIRAIQNILAKATDERIIKMKKTQLEHLEQSFKEKQEKLLAEINKCDIIASKLAIGILHVEN